jgi:uncharacterized protein (DUF427 family)
VRVELGGAVVAASDRALRVLETSHPPTVYLPPGDVAAGALVPVGGATWCEWKGSAAYFDVVGGEGRRSERSAWAFPSPVPQYAELTGFVSFYPSRVDACWIGDERVRAQEGDFYGGWITADLVGPFKGAPGTLGW